MKALTIKGPWAWLIVHGHKSVENRTWSTEIRGLVLIHASTSFSRSDYDAARKRARMNGVQLPPMSEIPRASVIGMVNLCAVIDPGANGGPWHNPDSYGFVFDEACEIPPIKATGQLRFWDFADQSLG